MNPKRITELLGRLAVLKYFPGNSEEVLEGLLVMVGEMCHDESQVAWLVKRMTSGIYAEWPGPQEMRACFCSRFAPADGINAYSTVYPDGLPPSKESRLALSAGPQLGLPPGHGASADTDIEDAFRIAAKVNSVTRDLGGPASAAEIRAAPAWLRRLEGR